jgi:hypothetical protein
MRIVIMKFIFLFLILILSADFISAEYRLNFFVGDIKIQQNGKKEKLTTGMIIPDNAVIVTGKKSQAHLYDSSRGIRLTIGPETEASVDSFKKTEKISDSLFFQKFRKGIVYTGKSTTAAVRAETIDSLNKDFILSEDDWKDETDRSAEWKLFEKSEYEQIIQITGDAADYQGMFLFAASVYFHEGDKSGEKAAPVLEKVIAGTGNSKLKTEAMRLLSAIYFSQAFFDRSCELMAEAVNNTQEDKITEADYYILVQSLFFLNRNDEGERYLTAMRKYYPGSELMSRIIRY